MMTENADKKREQIHLLCMDEMVPKYNGSVVKTKI